MTNPLNTDFSKILNKASKGSNAKTKGTRELEGPMTKDAVKWLNSLPNCGAKKRRATQFNRSDPDVTGALQGLRIEMEAKVGNNQPTPKQAERLRYWTELGCITGVFWSKYDCAKIICKHMGWDLEELLRKYPL